MAYGPLALLPEQFWALTYRQFIGLIKGLEQRQDMTRRRDAWLLANLLQPHTKDKLKPSMFLGEEDQSGKWNKITEEEYAQLMARKQPQA